VQLPDAASLDRTEKVVRQMSDLALQTPGVEHAIGFTGLSIQGFVNLSNSAVLFFPLADFDKRKTKDLSAGRDRRGTQQEVQHHSGCDDFRRAAAAGAGPGQHGWVQAVHPGSRRAWLR
jgi:multidrug efflux pump subunit AcrB